MISTAVERVYCFYDMDRLPPDAPLQGTWSVDGSAQRAVELASHERDPDAAYARGQFIFWRTAKQDAAGDASSRARLAPGIYEVTLTSPDYPDISAIGSFVALPRAGEITAGGGKPPGPASIEALQTAVDVTDDGEPIKAATTFGRDTDRVAAVFDYRGVAVGSVLTVRWHFGEMEIPGARTEIAVPASEGWAEAWLATAGSEALSPGAYSVSIHLDGEKPPLGQRKFTIE